MHPLTISLLSVLLLFSPLCSSIPHAHPHPAPSQIDLDYFLSLTPLIVPDPPPPDVLAGLAEQAKSNNLSESLPTPIADQYPDQLTGSLNCSYFIIPISYKEARSIIPAQYPILTSQIKKAWRGHDKHNHKHPYPLILSVQLDHDISILDAAIPDFNLVAFRFPFVDLLGDGHTPFTYLPTDILSNTTLGVSANKVYGIDAIVADFTPFRDPYAYVPGATAKGPRSVKAIPVDRGTGKGFRAEFEDKGKLSDRDFDLYVYACLRGRKTSFSSPRRSFFQGTAYGTSEGKVEGVYEY